MKSNGSTTWNRYMARACKYLFFFLMSWMIQWGSQAQTTRLYLVGNSVTDAINYAGLKAIAESTGKTHIWGRHMIPGAPLNWLWTHMGDGFTENPFGAPDNAFPNYTWDAISLQPFDRQITGAEGDLAMAGNYINLARGKSPNVQFYVYCRWPRKPSNYQGTADEWTNLWLQTYTGGWDNTNETRDYFEKLTQAIRTNHTNVSPALIVPVGEVFYQLNLKMKAGQVPGFTKIWDVYSDGIHLTSVGSYIAGLTYYSTIYKADPRGTAVPGQYGTINSTVVNVIQQTVWDVVSTYSWSGVTSTNVPVSSVSVTPGTLALTVGQTGQLTATISPANATNKTVNWSSSNSLVASVNASGLVSAAGAGTATITAITADGAKTATSTITVTTSGGGGGTTSGILANWDFVGKGGSSSVPGANLLQGISAAVASIGPGMTAINYINDGLTASNHNSANLAEAITNNDYIRFTLSPASGNSVTVSSIKIIPVSQNRERTFALFSSKNGFSAANMITSFNASANTNGPVQNLTISGHSGITSEIEFRLYIYGTGFNIYEAVGMGNAPGVDLELTGSVSGGDTQAPSAPSNLAATNVKHDRFDLSWTHSTDNVGVTGYDVFRGSTKINTALVTANNFAVTGLSACTDYSITVRAYDAAGNSTTSNALAVKTNCPPTAVLNATPTSGTPPLTVAFNTTGSTDPDAGDFILGYEWNFGDGSAINNSNTPTHVYTSAGTYTVTLRVMDNRDLYSAPVTRVITVNAGSSLREPENPSNTVAGLEYSYYEGEWSVLPNFSALTAVKTGTVSNFDISVRNRNDNFAFRYIGFVNVPADGTYTFYTSSDDGSKLYIGSTEVVNNDGLHGIQERSGTIGLKAGKHAITVTFFERTGGEHLTVSWQGPGVSKAAIPNSALFRVSGETIVTGSIVREYWSNISGTSVSNIPLGTTPTGSDVLTSLEGPTNWADNYGTRIRGYIVPSTSGSYTFYIAGDDNSELWISPDANPTNKTKRAQVTTWTSSRQWNKEAGQQSAAINLVASTKYYVEVLHKEGGGGDNIAVGWTGPGISTITVIPGVNLARFEGGTTPPPVDTEAPSVPAGLAATNVTQTSLTLTWNASTDNVGVTGYEVFRGTTSIGTPSSTSFNVTGLTASTQYSFRVRARDAANNWSAQSNALNVTTPGSGGGTTPKMPIGMNIPSLNYYEGAIFFTDVMTTASDMMSFVNGGGAWNTEKINSIPKDVNGYPTQVPYTVDGQPQVVRFMINNNYVGRYVILHEGVGQLRVNVVNSFVENGRLNLDLNGNGGHVWIDILESQQGNHIRNIRILPKAYENSSSYPTFDARFLDGLRPFHALRFMDWVSTNNSNQRVWGDRIKKTHYSQATGRGTSLEHAIELCNLLDMDGWFCVPHLATDDYITQMARLIRDNLKPSLKVYIEYSNEIWNWQFQQAGWVVNNAPGAEAYVQSDLAAIGAAGTNHPEKDAYMMARTFRLFKNEFTGSNATRLIRVAAVQHGWYDNTRRVLQYLFNVNGQGCDMVSPAGYFSFEESHHNTWNAMDPSSVTPLMVIDAVFDIFDATSGHWTQKNAEYANQFGVGYAVYEGGQHMQPHNQGEWAYNHAVWDAQIHPKMYDLYMKNFQKHAEPVVNCQIFMAFSYMGTRQSRYGSWGHLENLNQIGGNYMQIAPKYQALLDANSPRTKSASAGITSTIAGKEKSGSQVMIYPNPAANVLTVTGLDGSSTLEVMNMVGAKILVVQVTGEREIVPVENLSSGVYYLRVSSNGLAAQTLKFVKQ